MATEEEGQVVNPIQSLLADLRKRGVEKPPRPPTPAPDPAAEMLEKTVEVTDKKAKEAADKGEAVYSVWTCPACQKQHVLEWSEGMKVQCACSREGMCEPSDKKRVLKK